MQTVNELHFYVLLSKVFYDVLTCRALNVLKYQKVKVLIVQSGPFTKYLHTFGNQIPIFKTFLKQLNETFHLVLILAVPVDKGSRVSPNVRLHIPFASFLAARRLLCREESRPQPRRRTFS